MRVWARRARRARPPGSRPSNLVGAATASGVKSCNRARQFPALQSWLETGRSGNAPAWDAANCSANWSGSHTVGWRVLRSARLASRSEPFDTRRPRTQRGCLVVSSAPLLACRERVVWGSPWAARVGARRFSEPRFSTTHAPQPGIAAGQFRCLCNLPVHPSMLGQTKTMAPHRPPLGVPRLSLLTYF